MPGVREAALIRRNIRGYRRLHRQYEGVRSEIFNPVEQGRLRASLVTAFGERTSASTPPRALDFGCGSGNLTSHLVDLGASVTAADVSPDFLRLVAERFPAVKTHRLNGRNLDGVPDGSFDFVGTYSVLHHIPDYLAAVRELARVLAPGGILYIDHEAAPDHWVDQPAYSEFLAQVPAPPQPPRTWRRFVTPANYRRQLLKIRSRVAPRYVDEGDIHVWPDDHIEWEQIEAVLRELGCTPVRSEDYLVYRDEYPVELWERYRSRCVDMRSMSARKS